MPDARPDEYGELYADVYDDWYPAADSTDDAVATLTLLGGGGPVLDLGAGTGRLSIPLGQGACEVWALDNSPRMLARLQAKAGSSAIRIVEADMARFELPADAPHFSLVFAAFNTLFLLPDRTVQQECLRSVAAVLRPGGRLVLDLFVPPRHLAETGQLELTSLAADGLVLRAFRRGREPGVIEGQHVEITEAGIRLRPWRLATCSPAEVDEMADAAGLQLVDRWGAWNRTPFAAPDPAHVSVYLKQ